jgi:hypothetical protein
MSVELKFSLAATLPSLGGYLFYNAWRCATGNMQVS